MLSALPLKYPAKLLHQISHHEEPFTRDLFQNLYRKVPLSLSQSLT